MQSNDLGRDRGAEMSDLYKRIELKEGEPVLFVGVHILRWQFDEWGEPTFACVEAEPDDKDATIAKLTAQRDALLEACKAGRSVPGDGPYFIEWLGNEVRIRGHEQAGKLAREKARLEKEAIELCEVTP